MERVGEQLTFVWKLLNRTPLRDMQRVHCTSVGADVGEPEVVGDHEQNLGSLIGPPQETRGSNALLTLRLGSVS